MSNQFPITTGALMTTGIKWAQVTPNAVATQIREALAQQAETKGCK